MSTTPHAAKAGAGTPESDNARGANAGQVGKQESSKCPDSHSAPHTGQALQAVEAWLAQVEPRA